MASDAKQISSSWKERSSKVQPRRRPIWKTVKNFVWNWDTHIKMLFAKNDIVFFILDINLW